MYLPQLFDQDFPYSLESNKAYLVLHFLSDMKHFFAFNKRFSFMGKTKVSELLLSKSAPYDNVTLNSTNRKLKTATKLNLFIIHKPTYNILTLQNISQLNFSIDRNFNTSSIFTWSNFIISTNSPFNI